MSEAEPSKRLDEMRERLEFFRENARPLESGRLMARHSACIHYIADVSDLLKRVEELEEWTEELKRDLAATWKEATQRGRRIQELEKENERLRETIEMR